MFEPILVWHIIVSVCTVITLVQQVVMQPMWLWLILSTLLGVGTGHITILFRVPFFSSKFKMSLIKTFLHNNVWAHAGICSVIVIISDNEVFSVTGQTRRDELARVLQNVPETWDHVSSELYQLFITVLVSVFCALCFNIKVKINSVANWSNWCVTCVCVCVWLWYAFVTLEAKTLTTWRRDRHDKDAVEVGHWPR